MRVHLMGLLHCTTILLHVRRWRTVTVGWQHRSLLLLWWWLLLLLLHCRGRQPKTLGNVKVGTAMEQAQIVKDGGGVLEHSDGARRRDRRRDGRARQVRRRAPIMLRSVLGDRRRA